MRKGNFGEESQDCRRDCLALDSSVNEMRPPLVYLASPYSHPDKAIQADRFQKACHAAGLLLSAGIMVFSPIAHGHPIAEAGRLPGDWKFWKAYSQIHLNNCSELIVLMLDGWDQSLGVAEEIRIMEQQGKRVFYLSPNPFDLVGMLNLAETIHAGGGK